MKKSKKLSLQSLALVLMSFILVAGVAFGMTGAWFTHKDASDPQSVTLQNGVSVSLSDFEFASAYAMPGDTVNLGGKVVAAEDSSEFRMRVKATIDASAVTEDGVTITEITIGTEKVQVNGQWAYLTKTLKDGEEVAISASVTLVGDKLINDDATKAITVTLEVQVIQAANTENTEAFWNGITAEDTAGAIVAQAEMIG